MFAYCNNEPVSFADFSGKACVTVTGIKEEFDVPISSDISLKVVVDWEGSFGTVDDIECSFDEGSLTVSATATNGETRLFKVGLQLIGDSGIEVTGPCDSFLIRIDARGVSIGHSFSTEIFGGTCNITVSASMDSFKAALKYALKNWQYGAVGGFSNPYTPGNCCNSLGGIVPIVGYGGGVHIWTNAIK